MRPSGTTGDCLERLALAAILVFVATCLPGCGKAELPRGEAQSAAEDLVVDWKPETLGPAADLPVAPPDVEGSKTTPQTMVAVSPAEISPKRLVEVETDETLQSDAAIADDPTLVLEPETAAGAEQASQAEASPPVRLLLPTTSGPLLVAVDIRLGDQPLEEAFHSRIDSVIDQGNEDQATALTWNELFEHVAADPEQFGRQSIPNSSQYRDLIRRYDGNHNQRPDPDEVAKFLFRNSNFDGPFRLVGSDYFRNINRSKSSVFAAIDADRDGILQTNELERAAEAIVALDQNADGRLDINEAVGDTIDDNLAWNRRRSHRRGDVAMDLAGYVDWPMVSYALDGMTGTTPLGIKANPVALVDENNNDSISADEARNLLAIEPHLTLRIEYSADSSGPAKILVTSVQPGLESFFSANERSDQISISDGAFRLSAHVVDGQDNQERIPSEVYAMLDANDDGGLDESEIPPGVDDRFAFEDLDQDQDGKLTLAEINNPRRTKLPIWSVQVRGRGAEIPDAVFAWLDENHDHLLSAREISHAGDRLRQCAEQKESIEPSDIPDSFSLQLVRGDPSRDAELFAMRQATAARPIGIPNWAVHMDVNRDGDISWQEFPGSREQFDEMDTNGDGFISTTEIAAL